MGLRSLTNSVALLGYCVGSTFEFFSNMERPGRFLAIRCNGDFVVVKEVNESGVPKRESPEFPVNRNTRVKLI